MKTGITSNKKKKVVVSWTGGKDGCFACYNALSEGYGVSYLLSFRDRKRSGSHELNPALLSAQSHAIGIPIVQTDFISYEQEFKNVIRKLKENGAVIDGAVFGHIETHKELVVRICIDMDIELILPLWNRDSAQIITDFIDAGFEAIIVSAHAGLFDKEWLGRRIDRTFVSDLRGVHKGVDSCGEFGEYHSFVIDGPVFKNRIRVVSSEKMLRDGYWFLDITNYAIDGK